VIHDINFHHRPADLPAQAGRYYNRNFPKFAARASRIGTVSEFSRQDIAESYRIDPSKIDLLYNGAGEHFKPIDRETREKVRKKWSDGEPYFIFIGNLHPRKNVPNLLRAYDRFRATWKMPVKLLVVGERYFLSSEMDRVYRQMAHRSEVQFTGRLSQHDLALVLGAAEALVFVPLFEGFGIPLLEAMNCEVPIVASNTSSIPEVAGDAAILVDPLAVEEIAEGMKEIIENKTLREQLLLNGRKRRSLFSWDDTARRLWEGIHKCTP
jgi:glycosyltransferase involved in cell wall biosynthesis